MASLCLSLTPPRHQARSLPSLVFSCRGATIHSSSSSSRSRSRTTTTHLSRRHQAADSVNRLSICCCASSDSSSGTSTSSSGSTTSVSQPQEAWTVTGTHTHHARRFTLQMKTPVEISLRPMHTPAVHYAIEELKPNNDEVGSPTGAMVEKVADPESRVQPGDVLVEVRAMGDNEPWGVEDVPFEDIVAAVNQKGTQVALTFERFPQQDVEPGEFMAGHSS